MSLETASYISQLVSSNPTATDPVGQGDDHLRLIKSVLLTQFPNFTAAALASSNTAIDTVTAALTTTGALNPGLLVPTGTVLEYAGASAPSGYLLCDGTSYSTATQAALFAVTGYTFGGSGANFNVPDKRGRAGVGIDTATNRLGSYAGSGPGTVIGEAQHVLTQTEMPSHTHTANDSGHAHGASDTGHSHSASDSGHFHGFNNGNVLGDSNAGSGFLYSGGDSFTIYKAGTTAVGVANISVATGNANVIVAVGHANIVNSNTGSGGAHNNVQPGLVMNYIIKT